MADLLYACDGQFWRLHGGVPAFEGVKVTQDAKAAAEFGLRLVSLKTGRDELLFERFGVLGWGGNSGFHAVNLAAQLGAARLVLVGFDMTARRGMHWHGRHGPGLHNPTTAALARWAEVLDRQAHTLASRGVEVVNTSPISALMAYPKLALEEALAL